MNNSIVVGIGEALWDCLPNGKKIGGAPANFAYHVSQFGLNGYAISAVGNDELGTEIINVLQAKGVRNIMSVVDYPTGTVQVKLDDNGVPQYDIKTDVAWDNIPLTEPMLNLAKQAKAVCWGSLAQRNAVSRNTIYKFIAALQPDALKIFDINLRLSFYTQEIIEQSLRKCDILKINDEELIIISQMLNGSASVYLETSRAICEELIKRYNLKMLILTCGTQGSYLFTADGQSSFEPTPHVAVADTVGAGDSFTGAFIASILSGMNIVEAHKIAVKVSAFVCTQNGAMPSYDPKTI
ncbi:MAG: carbohydrate kinase [Marinilabiliaceae bacterium]|nr:carbohydrate kinase [Marinilabiliaceae bacterium]